GFCYIPCSPQVSALCLCIPMAGAIGSETGPSRRLDHCNRQFNIIAGCMFLCFHAKLRSIIIVPRSVARAWQGASPEQSESPANRAAEGVFNIRRNKFVGRRQENSDEESV